MVLKYYGITFLLKSHFFKACISVHFSYSSFSLFFQIQNQWVRFTDKIDKMVEEALRINAKWSLQELSRAINGDGKNTPNPLFR